jgi:hypothetical protein
MLGHQAATRVELVQILPLISQTSGKEVGDIDVTEAALKCWILKKFTEKCHLLMFSFYLVSTCQGLKFATFIADPDVVKISTFN